MPTKESFDIDGLMVFRSDLTAVDQDGNIVASVTTPDKYVPSLKEPLSGEQIGRYTNTTAYWEEHATYIPKKGEVIIYSDAGTITLDGQQIPVPKIKIGTGNDYVGQLPFVNQDEVAALDEHISDNVRHITDTERARWNSKLNIDPNPASHYSNETIIFSRN